MDVGSAPASGTTSAKRSRSPSPSAAAKKVKTEAPAAAVAAAPASTETKPSSTSLLPPSTFIFGRQKQTDGSADTLRPPMETDVGILEYVRREGDAFHGIIKQRFTDFLVNEVTLTGETLHLKDITQPVEPPMPELPPAPEKKEDKRPTFVAPPVPADFVDPFEANERWPASHTATLVPLLGLETVTRLRDLWLEGKTPPVVAKKAADAGWGGPRRVRGTDEEEMMNDMEEEALREAREDEAVKHARERIERQAKLTAEPSGSSTPTAESTAAEAAAPASDTTPAVQEEEAVAGSAEPAPDAEPVEAEDEETLRIRGGSGRGDRGGGRGRGGDRGRGGRGRGGGDRGGRGGRGGWRGGDRGGRGGGGGDRGGPRPSKGWGGGAPKGPVDTRTVVTEPIPDKPARTALHLAIRELFQGELESSVADDPRAKVAVPVNADPNGTKFVPDAPAAPSPEDGQKIVIKYSKGRRGKDGGGWMSSDSRSVRKPTQPPYIHFTMQKTNRDTQDVLQALSRQLHCSSQDLTVAGTKDKRGVTVQRVCLRRGGKKLGDVWSSVNNTGNAGDRSLRDVLKERGERGVRVGDFEYSKSYLELGMLKGNEFVITLRGVQVEDPATLDLAMESIKTKGFINYYGMQRFGTSHIPTHAVGLAILQQDWALAVDLLLRPRPGEHADAEQGRQHWKNLGDADAALAAMPRRCVAERSLLEFFKTEGKKPANERDNHGALLTIPRNLRLIYVHAYQSYVWNLLVSERVREFGADKPVVGDLVMEKEEPVAVAAAPAVATQAKSEEEAANDNMEVDGSEPSGSGAVTPAVQAADMPAAPAAKPQGGRGKKDWKTSRSIKTRTITEADVANGHDFSIFDVVMPIPGFDVDLPGGKLRDMYEQILTADGLDVEGSWKKQKEYHLPGSYRKILHLPGDLSWQRIPYTDPDVSLAQADEDVILERDPPPTAADAPADARFLALQIRLKIGTAAYATMALREVTKTETSSAFQTQLTAKSADQAFRGTEAKEDAAAAAAVSASDVRSEPAVAATEAPVVDGGDSSV